MDERTIEKIIWYSTEAMPKEIWNQHKHFFYFNAIGGIIFFYFLIFLIIPLISGESIMTIISDSIMAIVYMSSAIFIPSLFLFNAFQMITKRCALKRIGLSRRGVYFIRSGAFFKEREILEFIPWSRIRNITYGGELGKKPNTYKFYSIVTVPHDKSEWYECRATVSLELIKKIFIFLGEKNIEVIIDDNMVDLALSVGYNTRKVWEKTVRKNSWGNTIIEIEPDSFPNRK